MAASLPTEQSEAVARIVAGWPPLTTRQQDVIQRVFAGRMEPARKSA